MAGGPYLIVWNVADGGNVALNPGRIRVLDYAKRVEAEIVDDGVELNERLYLPGEFRQ